MRVAVVGARGQLGQALLHAFAEHDVRGLTRDDGDLADREVLRRALRIDRPDLVLNAIAFTDVNGAEANPEEAFRVNALGARWLAQAAQETGAAVVYISTDYVFAGDGGAPYHEWATTRPLSVYGASKLAGEHETLGHAGRAWIVRTSWLYGGPGKTFVNAIVAAAATRAQLDVVADEVGGPTLTRDLAEGIRALVGCDAPGVYHLANAGEVSRDDFARAILDLSGSATSVRSTTNAEYWAGKRGVATRPAHSTLANRAAAAIGVTMRPWREALADHLCASR